jgi:hypothetical protein
MGLKAATPQSHEEPKKVLSATAGNLPVALPNFTQMGLKEK